MKAQKYFGILVILALLIALVPAVNVSAAVMEKVNVCHFDKDASVFFLINISENAFQSHVDHGDAAPGQLVPGTTDMKFTSDCLPVPVNDVTGTWTGFSGLVGNLRYGFNLVLVQHADKSVTGTITYTLNSTAIRSVTGNLVGNVLTITTADASYSATVSGITTENHFYGVGTDSSGYAVALDATK